MRAGGGKTKGTEFEKKIARIIGEWWCRDKKAFWHSHGSGSLATFSPEAKIHPGDIVPIKRVKKFPLCIECKKRQTWNFKGLIAKGKDSVLGSYWTQCKDEAGEYVPWLIFSKNFDYNYLMMPYNFFRLLLDSDLKHANSVYFRSLKTVIMILEDFLTICDSNVIRECFKKWK